jgi:hypothetical protein
MTRYRSRSRIGRKRETNLSAPESASSPPSGRGRLGRLHYPEPPRAKPTFWEAAGASLSKWSAGACSTPASSACRPREVLEARCGFSVRRGRRRAWLAGGEDVEVDREGEREQALRDALRETGSSSRPQSTLSRPLLLHRPASRSATSACASPRVPRRRVPSPTRRAPCGGAPRAPRQSSRGRRYPFRAAPRAPC